MKRRAFIEILAAGSAAVLAMRLGEKRSIGEISRSLRAEFSRPRAIAPLSFYDPHFYCREALNQMYRRVGLAYYTRAS